MFSDFMFMPCMAIMLASSVLLICCEMNSIAYISMVLTTQMRHFLHCILCSPIFQSEIVLE